MSLNHVTDFVDRLDMLSWSLVVFSVTIMYFYYKYSYWTRRGIKGPKPLPVLGNLYQMFLGDPYATRWGWFREYGKVYGLYMGTKPVLSINDAELNRKICIEDFEAFTGHQRLSGVTKYQENFVVFMHGDHWKRVRALLTPTFIKRMFKLLEVCSDDLIQVIERKFTNQKNESEKSIVVHLKDLYSLYTLDAIIACCYGLRIERGPDIEDINSAAAKGGLAAAAMQIFKINISRFIFLSSLPVEVRRAFRRIGLFNEEDHPLAKITEQIIEKRRLDSSDYIGNNRRKFDDYLQILVDARMDEELELDELDHLENHHAALTENTIQDDQRKMVKHTLSQEEDKKSVNTNNDNNNNNHANCHKDTKEELVRSNYKLEDIEIVSSAMFLIAVGLETTSMLLTNVSYALAHFQEIQEKLYQVLLELVDKSTGGFTYESLVSSHYLDAVISETLRLLSPIVRTDREADRDYFLEKLNLTIEKGTVLELITIVMHMDPNNWTDPELFDPERFMPCRRESIVPGSYCPFGIGPRHCLGMRFSLIEAKLALAKIMMKYRFDKLPNTEFPPKFSQDVGLLKIQNPLVNLIKRTD